MRSLEWWVGVAAAVAVAGCAQMQGGASKSPPRPQAAFGQPISEADIAPWNIDIRTPDGQGLPAGRGTVADGKKIYDAKCLACHGADAKGGPVYGTMVGGIGSFTTTRGADAGSMYHAPIRSTTSGGDADDAPVADERRGGARGSPADPNGLIPANAVMDAKTLPAVQMPNRTGFIVDDRPDTKAVRCMSNCK
jgi:cytochrome c